MRDWCFVLVFGQFASFSSSSHFVLRLYRYAGCYKKIKKKRHVHYRYLSRNTTLAPGTNPINHSDHNTLLLKHIEGVIGALFCCLVSLPPFLQAHILYCVCTLGHTQKIFWKNTAIMLLISECNILSLNNFHQRFRYLYLTFEISRNR